MNKNSNMVSMKFFVHNLNLYMYNQKLYSITQLSDNLNLNRRRVESWLGFQKVPSISTLDGVADTMNVSTPDLIRHNIDFNLLDNNIIICNNSPKMFCINFRKILNKYDIKTANEFSCYVDGNISTHTYYSYFKTNNPKIPSLRTIEYLASHFNIKPYKLIERI